MTTLPVLQTICVCQCSVEGQWCGCRCEEHEHALPWHGETP